MSNLVSLKTRQDQTNEATITMLRDYLAAAERGEIVAVAVAALEPGGASRTSASSSENFQSLFGAVTILQHRMFDQSRVADPTVGG